MIITEVSKVSVIVAGVCCLDEIFLAAITDNLQEKGNKYRIMSKTNFTTGGIQTKKFGELLCSPSLVGGLKQETLPFAAVNILLAITAFVGNSLILVALHKESSLHPPSKLLYRSLAKTDLMSCLVSQLPHATLWMHVDSEQWSLCLFAYDAANITGYALCSVSLLTITAISVDRLLARLLGLRYKQIVTLKRIYIIVVTFWVVSVVAALCFILNYHITLWYGRIIIPSCLVISVASYSKIFHTLSPHQAKIHDPVQQHPRLPNALNMARYRKAVNGAVWVQLAIVVCYLPYCLVEIVITHSKTYSSHLVVLWEIAIILIYFNSTINPFLYCWKISEVKQAVKQTIRQELCCPWS